MKLVHQLIAEQNEAFAWNDSERGSFHEDFFPPVQIPVIPHKPWVLKNISILPGIHEEVCRIIKMKEAAGVYEPSNSSYCSRWFCVIKKDRKSLRIVHSLEPLNAVTITDSGLPPVAKDLAECFAGCACGGMFDLYVGYNERKLAPESRDLTMFQTPFGARHLVTLPVMICLFLFFHLFTSCAPSHDLQSVSLSIAAQCLIVTTCCCATPHL